MTLLGMLSLHAATFIVLTNASDMRWGSIQHRKECGSERVGCGEELDAGKSWMRERVGCGKESDARRPWKAEALFVTFVFLGLAREFCDGERGKCVEENGPVPQSIEGWEEGFVIFIYAPVFTVS